jgi:hypothetical protein
MTARRDNVFTTDAAKGTNFQDGGLDPTIFWHFYVPARKEVLFFFTGTPGKKFLSVYILPQKR